MDVSFCRNMDDHTWNGEIIWWIEGPHLENCVKSKIKKKKVLLVNFLKDAFKNYVFQTLIALFRLIFTKTPFPVC